jgi:RNA polymerase sigma factor (sigma-70 family)
VDEYYDICAIGLCKAAARFDPSREYKFTTLAYAAMDNEVKNFWRDSNTQTRRPKFPILSLFEVMQRGKTGAGGTICDTIVANDRRWKPSCDRINVDVFVDSLPEREKQIVNMRLAGLTISEIGNEVGRTHQRVSQILNTVREKYIREMAM